MGLPLSIRSAFYPIFGDAVWGWVGHVIDVVAVFATLFGLATSLGFGAEQAVAGIDFLFGSGETLEGTRRVFGFDYGNPVVNNEGVEIGATGAGIKILLILVITGVALMSVINGSRQRREARLRDQHGAGVPAAALRAPGRPDGGDPVERSCESIIAYLGYIPRAEHAVRARGRELQPGLDGVLLGLVDLLVALRRHVHRPRQPRPDGARVHDLRAADPQPGLRACG